MTLLDHRVRLLGVMARRAEQCTRYEPPFRRLDWPVIEAALFVHRARIERSLPARRFVAYQGTTPLWQIAAAARSNLGRGDWPCSTRGARTRLADYLAVCSAFQRMGEGLRFGELLALTGLTEQRLHRILVWGQRQCLLFDAGERGWFERRAS